MRAWWTWRTRERGGDGDGDDGVRARGGGPRIVVVRSKRACAVANERGECVDGTRPCGLGFWDAVFETRDGDGGGDARRRDGETRGRAISRRRRRRTGGRAVDFTITPRAGARRRRPGRRVRSITRRARTVSRRRRRRSRVECDVLAASARRARATTATTAMREAHVSSPGERYRARVARERQTRENRTSTSSAAETRLNRRRLRRYDVAANVWERAPRLNEPRGSHGACAVGSKIVVVSGGGVKSNLASAETLAASDCGARGRFERACNLDTR